jgi:quinol monooxygenase YgiN
MKADDVTLMIDMRFATGRTDQGVQLLVSVGGRIEAKQGCQSFSVARDAVDADRIHYRETWASEAALQRHVQSEEFRRILVAMDMCSEEPQVAIGNFAGHTGLVYLQKLCGRQGAGEPGGSA